ncbi:nucleoside diphosphate kinase 6 isoform X2 [Tachyglossus aculeatus]|uniref:nucleoside diphosphate kinase 6 isoform X2 n=1 Tax=Tachyglossus aculeatus TaxID=9261 RepID=UPI0018F2FDFF|nr:nucleoside diphosphate kinase 6 isoform X2 [Tachyglossus aculeatus]XP_038600623.1 nucleoside diphosphate kinase 6 isoform X2 [Tachyglossus aculeatus]
MAFPPGSPRTLQLTLALMKPDAVAHPLILEAVRDQILKHGFLIVRARELLWAREDCRAFYREHAGRFFYQRLVEFMSSGPMRACILARVDAVRQWRALLGPTKVFRARHEAPDSIRGSYGLTDTRNTVHGSERWLPSFRTSAPSAGTARRSRTCAGAPRATTSRRASTAWIRAGPAPGQRDPGGLGPASAPP